MRDKKTTELRHRWQWLFWETLIIVLGVLIAFAVNDFWSDRHDRELEMQYRKRFHADLESDEKLDSELDNAVSRKLLALDAIAPVAVGSKLTSAKPT